MNAEVEILTQECVMLLDVLSQLVNKIEADEANGTPLHPQGHPDCLWLQDGGYPCEYFMARQLLKRLSVPERGDGE